MIDEDPTLHNATGPARSIAWRTAGMFFLAPGAVVFLKSGLPGPTQTLAVLGCILGLVFVSTPRWPIRRVRIDMLIPLVAALYLYAMNATSGGEALSLWELVLWYSSGLMWVGLTQPARCLWTAPCYVLSFAMTTEAPFATETWVAATVSVGVMTMIAALMVTQLTRGRRAYARLRRGVESMTVVASAGKVPTRDRPSEIHNIAVQAALDLGYGGAGVARISRKSWEIRAWAGDVLSDTERGILHRGLAKATESGVPLRLPGEGRELTLIRMFRSGSLAYLLIAASAEAVEDEQHKALELLAAQTSRGLEILRMAFYDQLTGLPNRHLFQERLAEQIARIRADPKASFALMFMDIDRFKTVNDLYGHAIGDRFLAELASRLRHGVRGLDFISQRHFATPSRLGGDEFAILLPDLGSEEDATHVAERLDHLLGQPLAIGGREITTNPSIGVVLSHPRYTEASQMMRDADTAMYRAKRGGALQWAIFDSAMRTSNDRHLELERSLVGALDRGELRLQYQPIVETASRHPVGFEALLRWRHPELGEIGPGEFIPIAEATGQIDAIGRWVVRSAARAVAEWNREWVQAPPLYVTANVSRKQIGDRRLLEVIEATMEETGLRPDQFVVEITESMALLDRELTREFLHALRNLGVRLALDDFGTGYSSLSCLHEMPVQLLKLDREFAVAAQKDERALRAVDGAVRMAHAMGLQVVAEGVEEIAHLEIMAQVRCNLVQGYLISRPIERDAVSAWLDENTVLERDPDRSS